MLSVRFYITALISFLLILVFSGSIARISLAQYTQPDQLNQKGFALLHNGYPNQAFSAWQEAELLYRAEEDEVGIIGTQLNQAIAQQASGSNFLACRTLTRALSVSEQLCDAQVEMGFIEEKLSALAHTEVNSIGLRVLAEGFRLLGNLEAAEATLQVAQNRLPHSGDEMNRLQLTLANIHHLYFQESLDAYNRTSIRKVKARQEGLYQLVDRSRGVLNLYSTVGNGSGPEAIKAHLNTIELLALTVRSGVGTGTREEELIAPLFSAAEQAYEALGADKFDQLPTIDSIYAKLGLANDLLTLQRSPYLLSNEVSDSKIEQLIDEALALSKQVNNNTALSASYGSLGMLRLIEEQFSEAERQYAKAYSLAQSVQADEISYQWAYQLAKLDERRGKYDQARQYYQSAISSLDVIRNNLIAVNSELRFDFRDNVEPVYIDYMRFLSEVDLDPSQLVRVHDSLQLAQLENFLRCGRLVSTERPANQAIFHIVNLGSTIEVIVNRGDKTYSYSTPASDLLLAVERININTRSPAFLEVPEAEILPSVRQLYDALIRPAEVAGLLVEDVELSFVLDSPFQSVPMGLLHDGQQYLAAVHPITISVQKQGNVFSRKASAALFAGLSEAAPSFTQNLGIVNATRLQETVYERGYVEEYLPTKTLLNERFTTVQVGRTLSENTFNTVHISTHGQFGSTPEQTFLVAWDDTIDFVELSQLFQNLDGLELLFLSACQTAEGDDRATLGLAGLAVQSGAKNVIAPLWFQDTTGGSVLIQKFYQSLQKGLSPAQSLQQAQNFLINTQTLSHPYYWASFILAAS